MDCKHLDWWTIRMRFDKLREMLNELKFCGNCSKLLFSVRDREVMLALEMTENCTW